MRRSFFTVFTVIFISSFVASAAEPADIDALLRDSGLPVIVSGDSGKIDDVAWKLIEDYYKDTEPVTQAEVSQRAIMDESLAMGWLNTDRKEDLMLREIDKRATELVQEFHKANNAASPILGGNGAVQITYSSYTPKIMCRPMRVTDIMLQPGEKVTGVHAGDTARWMYTPGTSGSGEATVTHVMVKPLAPDIATNIVIHTDRRVYNLDLVSSAKEFFPSVSFGYPQDDMQKWQNFISEQRRTEGKILNEGTSVNPEDLNFGYEIRGTQPWKPLRVWDDGKQVYIQMPKGWERSGMEAPVLIVYERKKERIVNYRVKGDLIICDSLFKEKCALIAGTGARQDRVVILRKN